MIIALIVIVVVIVLLVLYVIVTYNGLIQLRNRVENAWSQIDVQLKRRLDLIPNLVETVKGYAAHERETLDAVVQARNAAIAAPGPAAGRPQAEQQLTGALRQLFALSEAYPDLKANQNFLSLQEELTATEGRVAYARQFYNDSVLSYNTKIQAFPASFFAGPMKLQARASTSRPTKRAREDAQGRSSEPSAVAALTASPCTNRSRQQAAQHPPRSARFVPRRSSLVGAAFGFVFGYGWRARSSPWSSPAALAFASYWKADTDRAGRQPGQARPTRSSTSACTTSSRACASPAACPSPASTSSTTRRPTPSPPAATRSTRPSPSRPACWRR